MTSKKIKQEKSISTFLQNFIKNSFALEGKILLDDSGKIFMKNTEQLKLNLEEEENFIDFISLYFKELNSTFFEEMKKTGSGFEGAFFVEKETQWFRVFISPVSVENATFFSVQLFDISKEKEMQKQLLKYKSNIENEMLLRTREIILTDQAMSADGGFLKNFLRGLRHDLVSPITQLQEIIKYYKASKNPEKKEKAGMLIDDCLRKLSNTSKGFSDFVDLHFAPKTGMEELSFEAVFQTNQILLEREIKAADADIKTNFSDQDKVLFNEKMLESIFYNLLSNAIKFKSDTRRLIIKIRTFRKDEQVHLEVEDNGIGMDLEKYGHLLFSPFKRIHNHRPGAGIGLSLIKNILTREDKGTIELESQVDQGTKVKIVFKDHR